MITCPTCGGAGDVPDTRSRVAELLAEGMSQADIGRELAMSRARVGQHKAAIEKAAAKT